MALYSLRLAVVSMALLTHGDTSLSSATTKSSLFDSGKICSFFCVFTLGIAKNGVFLLNAVSLISYLISAVTWAFVC